MPKKSGLAISGDQYQTPDTGESPLAGEQYQKSPNQRVKQGFDSLDRPPAHHGDWGADKLYLDKQDKYVVGKTA